jgi:hypothetical protein
MPALPCPDPVHITLLFRRKLLDTLLAQDKITPRLVEILDARFPRQARRKSWGR